MSPDHHCDTSARPVIRATPQFILARYSFDWQGDIKTNLGQSVLNTFLCTCLTFFYVVADHMYQAPTHISPVQSTPPDACLGNSSIFHLQTTSPARPRGVHHQTFTGGKLTVQPRRFSGCDWGRILRILPVSAKNSARIITLYNLLPAVSSIVILNFRIKVGLWVGFQLILRRRDVM